jgi:RHS repeat-associated protein
VIWDPASPTNVERYSFDVWGSRRAANTAQPGNLWTALNPTDVATQFGQPNSTTRKGYTGHEMLDQSGLIHMHARLYDPLLGRFIQADSMVEDDATQGMNRYTYCLNNPASRTDPTGNFSLRQILGAAIGIVAGIISAGIGFAAAWNLSLAAKFAVAVGGGFLSALVSTGSLRAGLWGALSAAVFFGIGQGFKGLAGPDGLKSLGGLTTGEFAAQVPCHAAAGGALKVLQGGKFGHGFLSAGISKALSPAIESFAGGSETAAQVVRGSIASAVVGGTVSVISGGKFGNAAAMGMFAYLFNQVVTSNDRPAPVPSTQEGMPDWVSAEAKHSIFAGPNSARGIIWPTDSGSVNDGFRMRFHPVYRVYKPHKGADIRARLGQLVYSTQVGFVLKMTSNNGGGNEIYIQNSDGSMSGYSHTSPVGLMVGQSVAAGEQIGVSDGSGVGTGPHLHYSYRPGSVLRPATLNTPHIDPITSQLRHVSRPPLEFP